jgi:similar to stage IV sporulation protein
MYKFLHKIFGAYTLRTDTENGVKLINLLNKEKLLFWGLKSSEDGFRIKASLFSCEPIIKAAASEGIRLEITRTTGIPFVFNKYKGRYGLILGSILGIFLIFCSELFVWEITVTGNNTVDKKEIVTALEKYGVKRGAFIPDLEIINAEDDFLIENKDISSIAINIKGTYAEVVVLERTYPPEIEDKNAYYNIVASHDGIIEKVEALNGHPEVKKGDAVVEGQLLINSFMLGDLGTYRLTHAKGNVYARVTEKYTISIPLEQTEKIYTGKTDTVKSVKVLGKIINLFSDEEPPFEFYDMTASEEEKKLFGFVKTPLEVAQATYIEYTVNRYTITEDEAKQRAAEAFAKYLDRLTDEVKSYDCDGYFDTKNNAYTLTASIIVLKNIAVQKPIDIVH